jgi:hypothetical protein
MVSFKLKKNQDTELYRLFYHYSPPAVLNIIDKKQLIISHANQYGTLEHRKQIIRKLERNKNTYLICCFPLAVKERLPQCFSHRIITANIQEDVPMWIGYYNGSLYVSNSEKELEELCK